VGLDVVQPGLFTTVQDRGRAGFRAQGVPGGGGFDTRSQALANALVGNDLNAATLEITLRGGVYEAEGDLALALAGAPIPAWIESDDGSCRAIRIPRSFTLRDGERLVLGTTLVGARSYLAVAGGWRPPVCLGSRSREQPLAAGDRLDAVESSIRERRPRPEDVFPVEPPNGSGIRIIDGPDELPPDEPPTNPWALRRFWVEARSDRMGVRLRNCGPLPVLFDPDRLSTPVTPGAIQATGEQLIVLGVACGTMGGYPHVGHVISADLPLLGQLRPGQCVAFERVSLAEARRLDREARDHEARVLMRVAVAARDGRVLHG
jgi:antagonist of KipI